MHYHNFLWLAALLAFSIETQAAMAFAKSLTTIRVGDAVRLELADGGARGVRWESSAPQTAQVFQNGFVAGLKPGEARIQARAADANETAECAVTVQSPAQSLVDPATLQQYPDDRLFTVHGRKCYGSELNGQRAIEAGEQRFTRDNRVINPKPLLPGKPLDWEVKPGAEVFDGADVLMGTVPATLTVGGRRLPVSMFNFGASKVLAGRICVYAFSVSIKPAAGAAEARVGTSAWMPLEDVVENETLLERIGLGKARLPALPLETTGYRVTGGDPKQYLTQDGELSIVRQVSIGAVPSHYLRRPSGTVNLVYSVPGFGLGGQGTDSFLVSDGLQFYPARGVRPFQQPTYFPRGSPQAGQPAPPTMTFLYGAVKCNGAEPVYGWIAREALALK